MNNQRLPHTDSINELANFWDTHDVTDFENELEDVPDRVFERGTEISVRLGSDEVDAIRAIAKSRGVDDSQVIREWVIEKIHSK